MKKLVTISGLKGKVLKDIKLGVYVDAKKYPNTPKSSWNTLFSAIAGEKSDQILTAPFKPLKTASKKVIKDAVLEVGKKGKLSRAKQDRLNKIIRVPIIRGEYGRKEDGYPKWVNTGKLLNSIFLRLLIKGKKY